jgi:hypothetical protein
MNEIYNTEHILTKAHINREAFYNILELLGVTDRKDELKLLELFINTPTENITKLANEMSRLKRN